MKHRRNSVRLLIVLMAFVLVLQVSAPALADAASKTISVFTGVEIYVDGVKMEPTDANGNPVEAFIYNGTTYVPLRAVSQYLGKNVGWDGATWRAYVGEVPGQKQYLLDVCPPYQSSYYKTPELITMAGQKYANGFTLGYSGFGSGWALYNLNGQYQTLEFDVGHIDGANMSGATLNIYLDGELQFSADLTGEMLPTHYSVPLYRALQMKIEITKDYGGCYGIVNAEIH